MNDSEYKAVKSLIDEFGIMDDATRANVSKLILLCDRYRAALDGVVSATEDCGYLSKRVYVAVEAARHTLAGDA